MNYIRCYAKWAFTSLRFKYLIRKDKGTPNKTIAVIDANLITKVSSSQENAIIA